MAVTITLSVEIMTNYVFVKHQNPKFVPQLQKSVHACWSTVKELFHYCCL